MFSFFCLRCDIKNVEITFDEQEIINLTYLVNTQPHVCMYVLVNTQPYVCMYVLFTITCDFLFFCVPVLLLLASLFGLSLSLNNYRKKLRL